MVNLSLARSSTRSLAPSRSAVAKSRARLTPSSPRIEQHGVLRAVTAKLQGHQDGEGAQAAEVQQVLQGVQFCSVSAF